jgi:hypothetical protein
MQVYVNFIFALGAPDETEVHQADRVLRVEHLSERVPRLLRCDA